MLQREITENYTLDIVSRLIDFYNDSGFMQSGIIKWAPPIVAFGKVQTSEIATVGLNPSNLEFMTQNKYEITGAVRRFHTLKSLNLNDWGEVQEKHLYQILEFCECYFDNNPYDAWFKRLDYVISGEKISYYFPCYNACHLDLVPFATETKWNDLRPEQKKSLIGLSKNSLGAIIKNSTIKVLVLNGQSVVDNFLKITDLELIKKLQTTWELKRANGKNVSGFSYEGHVMKIGEISLRRSVCVLGFNHNLQSSYGITKKVMSEIKNWITYQLNNH